MYITTRSFMIETEWHTYYLMPLYMHHKSCHDNGTSSLSLYPFLKLSNVILFTYIFTKFYPEHNPNNFSTTISLLCHNKRHLHIYDSVFLIYTA